MSPQLPTTGFKKKKLERVPVIAAEADVFEGWFGDILTEQLGPSVDRSLTLNIPLDTGTGY